MTRTSIIARGLACTSIAVLSACSFSASVGGLDYDKVESAITDELNKSYEPLGQKVSAVKCPELEDPKAGDTLLCTADVADTQVRVDVTIKDDDFNVNLKTRDFLFDTKKAEAFLSDAASQEVGTDVTVTCDMGDFFALPAGDTFDCDAVDGEGNTGTVTSTVGQDGGLTAEIS